VQDTGYVHVNQEIAQRVSGLITLGVSLLNILIVMRYLLELLVASPFNPFASLVYSITEPFMSVFQGLVRSPIFGEVTPELNTLIAIMVYSLLGWIATRLIRILLDDPK
jgi:uncharacterized protein YggT (Ycf19 family)